VINFTDRYAGTESCTEHSGFVRHNDAGRDDVEGEDRRGGACSFGQQKGKISTSKHENGVRRRVEGAHGRRVDP
jgi:hypothetical protein